MPRVATALHRLRRFVLSAADLAARTNPGREIRSGQPRFFGELKAGKIRRPFLRSFLLGGGMNRDRKRGPADAAWRIHSRINAKSRPPRARFCVLTLNSAYSAPDQGQSAHAAADPGRRAGDMNDNAKEVAPRDGFEPSANRLTAGCSTAELPGSSHQARRGYSKAHLRCNPQARRVRPRTAPW